MTGLFRRGYGWLSLVVLLVASGNAMAAENNADSLSVDNAYIREMIPGQDVAAGFLRLRNRSNEPVKIVSASSNCCERVEFHTHRHDGGMMRMEQRPYIVVAAQNEFLFSPGIDHLMFINAGERLQAGDVVVLELHTENNETLVIDVPVRKLVDHDHQH